MLTVLVVEDDASVARSVQQIVQRCCGGEALVAPTAAAARRILAERADLDALVIDQDLPDGHGLDFLALVRMTHPEIPAAVYSGTLPHGLTGPVFEPNTHYISKASGAELLKSFLQYAASRVTPRPGPLARDTIVAFGKWLGLPRMEVQVLLVAAETCNHKEICATLHIAESTLKTHVNRMLARARARGIRATNLVELVARLRTHARSGRPTTSSN
jgi:DNA-binding NarL/FixJ family response regulator